MIPTLILAAGQSSRMRGGDKLLEPIKGEAILNVIAKRALEVGPTVVTLPSKTHPRRAYVPKGAQIVEVTGQMSDSIKAGIKSLPDTATGVIILPCDMPEITAENIAAVKNTALTTGALIVRAATADGRAGHPIYFAAALFPRLNTLTGDRGAFEVCAALEDQTELVITQGNSARLDLDTPEDWADWRAKNLR